MSRDPLDIVTCPECGHRMPGPGWDDPASPKRRRGRPALTPGAPMTPSERGARWRAKKRGMAGNEIIPAMHKSDEVS